MSEDTQTDTTTLNHEKEENVVFKSRNRRFRTTLKRYRVDMGDRKVSQRIRLVFEEFLCLIPNTEENAEKIELAKKAAEKSNRFDLISSEEAFVKPLTEQDEIEKLEKRLRVLKKKQTPRAKKAVVKVTN